MEVPKNIVIIGAGIFGISTSIALAERYPCCQIHVIDRFEPPVPDATSVDTTRCIRFDYKDPVYSKLAAESLKKIENDPVLSKFFHKCGMSFVYNGKSDKWEDIFIKGRITAIEANENHPEKIVHFNSNTDVIQRIHGKDYIPKTPKELGRATWWNKGYCNLSNGFIDAEKSMKAYYQRAKAYTNVKFTFEEVSKIDYHTGTNKAKGVKLINGTLIESDLVIVAAGAWSGKLVDLRGVCSSSAIEVAWFKVSKEEQERWKNMSITTNLSTGINTFPPYEGEVKILRRSAGYKNTLNIKNPTPTDVKENEISISYPRTITTNPKDWIPKDAELALRENMKEIMPPLYKRPFDRTKLCWLTQTPTANFLIDNHPRLQNVVLATGGSAHAWKFVPIIGDKVVDFITGKLDPVLVDKWSWNEKIGIKQDNGSSPRMEGEAQEVSKVIRVSPSRNHKL